MAKTIVPSQLGYTAPGSRLRSQLFLGKNVNVQFEALGLGDDGRPDELQALKIHISQNGVAQGAIYLDVTDVLELKQKNSSLSGKELFLKLREASVCVLNEQTGEGEEKKIIILSSEPF